MYVLVAVSSRRLEKRISLLHRRESLADDKTSVTSMASSTMDNISLVTSTQSSLVSSSPLHNHQHKFMQVGPVTDLWLEFDLQSNFQMKRHLRRFLHDAVKIYILKR